METQIQIRRGTADDIEAVAAQELELGEQPQWQCSCTAGSSAMSTTGCCCCRPCSNCWSPPTASPAGWSASCCTRRLTCTASPSPASNVQSLFCGAGLPAAQGRPVAAGHAGRLAASSGFAPPEAAGAAQQRAAVNCYRRLGFEFLSDTENIGFFELWPAKFVNSMLRAAGRRRCPPASAWSCGTATAGCRGGLEAGGGSP
uniref:N-acetyltransferase domain-containing protein n=1 Tax=Macrostomum lignano TaxID=282301 RepID=A0A1I8FBZ5_9PLAT